MFINSNIKNTLKPMKLFSSGDAYQRARMLQPKVFQYFPMTQKLDANDTHYWCSCGLSINQPLCDGSHKGTIFRPLKFNVPKDGKYRLCACKYNLPSSGEKCDWSCIGNFFKQKLLNKTLHKEIPKLKLDDKDPRENLKRFLHVRDSEH